jgi:hypothetical protein
MPEILTVIINSNPVRVSPGTTVIAVIGIGSLVTRRSVRDMVRGPLCGMGVCQECRVCIDGQGQRLACQTECCDGMHVDTGEVAS